MTCSTWAAGERVLSGNNEASQHAHTCVKKRGGDDGYFRCSFTWGRERTQVCVLNRNAIAYIRVRDQARLVLSLVLCRLFFALYKPGEMRRLSWNNFREILDSPFSSSSYTHLAFDSVLSLCPSFVVCLYPPSCSQFLPLSPSIRLIDTLYGQYVWSVIAHISTRWQESTECHTSDVLQQWRVSKGIARPFVSCLGRWHLWSSVVILFLWEKRDILSQNECQRVSIRRLNGVFGV